MRKRFRPSLSLRSLADVLSTFLFAALRTAPMMWYRLGDTTIGNAIALLSGRRSIGVYGTVQPSELAL